MEARYTFRVIEEPDGYELFTVDVESGDSIDEAKENVDSKVREALEINYPFVLEDGNTGYRLEIENVHIK